MVENQVIQKPSKWKRRLRVAKYLLWSLFIIGGSYATVLCCTLLLNWCGAQYAFAMGTIKERLTEVKVIERVQVLDPEKVPVEDLINQLSADAGLNPLILKAIALQESGGYGRTDRYRYEAKLLPLTKNIKGTEDERKLWSGSWGLLQVIPIIWQKPCQLKSYSDLIDAKTNIECSIKILKLNLEACSRIKQPGARLREALRMYNGSGPDAEAYADTVMQRLADMLLLNLGDGV